MRPLAPLVLHLEEVEAVDLGVHDLPGGPQVVLAQPAAGTGQHRVAGCHYRHHHLVGHFLKGLAPVQARFRR